LLSLRLVGERCPMTADTPDPRPDDNRIVISDIDMRDHLERTGLHTCERYKTARPVSPPSGLTCVECGEPMTVHHDDLSYMHDHAALAAPRADAGHALHFDPSCEECAYLARPTRETLAPQADAGTLREAIEALTLFDPDAKTMADAAESMRRRAAALAASSPATAGREELDVERLAVALESAEVGRWLKLIQGSTRAAGTLAPGFAHDFAVAIAEVAETP